MRRLFLAVSLAFIFLPLIPSNTSAATCASLDGACRPTWVAGCAYPELPDEDATCPTNPNGRLVCCVVTQKVNDCTNGGGVCRSDYYDVWEPGEPACGYGGGVPSSESCGGLGQMCCLPPPPPTLDSFNVPAGCTIPDGASTCTIVVSWSISDAVAPSLKQNGTEISTLASSPGLSAALRYGSNTFNISDSGTSLGTKSSTAACGSDSTWDGTICVPNPPKLDSFNVPAGCTIPIGASNCSITVSWSISDAVRPAVSQDGTVFSNASSSPGVARPIGFGTSNFEIADDGTLLGSATSEGVCASGSSWDGSICAASSAVCTGSSTGRPGVCISAIACTGIQDTDVVCGPGLVCCVSADGNVCQGDVSGNTGTCRAVGTCLPSEVAESDSTHCGTLSCCTNSPLPGTCSGTCIPALIGCGSMVVSPTETCVDPGELCCVNSSPPPPPPPPVGPPLPGSFINFENPLVFNDINALICSLLNFFQGLIVVLALIFIIVGAFLYITSGGDEGRLTLAKQSILGALIGLAIGIAAPMLLRELANLLGWSAFAACSGFGSTLTLIQTATNVLNFLLSIIGVAALIMLVVGAFMYLTAAGDESRIDTGKSIVKYSIIGIAVALAALVLVRQVALFF